MSGIERDGDAEANAEALKEREMRGQEVVLTEGLPISLVRAAKDTFRKFGGAPGATANAAAEALKRQGR